MVSTGDRIRVDGAEAVVTARWASGRHTQFTLSDGRQLLDLHKRGDVELLAGSAPAIKEKPKAKKKFVRPQPLRIEDPEPEPETGTVEDLRGRGDVNGEDLLD
jgi:hypothetical protein